MSSKFHRDIISGDLLRSPWNPGQAITLHDIKFLTYSKTSHHVDLVLHGVLIESLVVMLLILILGNGLFTSKLVAVDLSFIQTLSSQQDTVVSQPILRPGLKLFGGLLRKLEKKSLISVKVLNP